MPTAGITTEPSFGSEGWGVNSLNQFAQLITMPEDGTITRVGGWLRGWDSSVSFRFCIWNSSRNTLLAMTSLLTASGAALSPSAGSNYEDDLGNDYDAVDGQSLYVGVWRNPNGRIQLPYENTGTGHYEDNNSSSSPGGMSGETLHSGRRLSFYFEYTVGAEVFTRRSSAWVKNQNVYVRRSSSWVAQGSEVYVRRSGVWVKA